MDQPKVYQCTGCGDAISPPNLHCNDCAMIIVEQGIPGGIHAIEAVDTVSRERGPLFA